MEYLFIPRFFITFAPMKLKRVFIRILKDLGCYSEFIKNFNTYPRYIERFNDGDKSLEHFLNLSYKKHLVNENKFSTTINDAFEWHEGGQGFDYWSDKNRKVEIIGKALFQGLNKLSFYDKKYYLPEYVNEEYIEKLKKIYNGEQKV